MVDRDPIEELWVLETDGSSHRIKGGGNIVLLSPNNIRVVMAIHFTFLISNNKGEYKASLLGLLTAQPLCVNKVQIRCDSQLVASK